MKKPKQIKTASDLLEKIRYDIDLCGECELAFSPDAVQCFLDFMEYRWFLIKKKFTRVRKREDGTEKKEVIFSITSKPWPNEEYRPSWRWIDEA